MITRRTFGRASVAAAIAALFPAAFAPAVRAAAAAGANAPRQQALETSDLVYLTPLHKSGKESRCHSEIWFVQKAGVVYVVTSNKAWRARAVGRGLVRARLWVGDFGTWQKSQERYRTAPTYVARGARVTDPHEIESVLDLYGSKYRVQWLMWNGRFRDGLKDGSRVMLRYSAEA